MYVNVNYVALCEMLLRLLQKKLCHCWLLHSFHSSELIKNTNKKCRFISLFTLYSA